MDPTSLEYDLVRGAAQPDSGTGPPAISGWARMGRGAIGTSNTAANCLGWTTASTTSRGNTVFLDPDWSNLASVNFAPWDIGFNDCAVLNKVWCIED